MLQPSLPSRAHRVFEAVCAIYGTVTDPASVGTAFDRIGAATGADYVHHVTWDRSAGRVLDAAHNGWPIREAFDDYAMYYSAIDPRRIALETHRPEAFYRCHQHIDARAVERSEFYQDFYLKYALRWVSATRLSLPDGIDVLFALVSTVDRAPLDDAAIADATRLLPHLKRAARLRHHLAETSGAALDAANLLHALPVGGVLLDSAGQWLDRNARSQGPVDALGIGFAGRFLRFVGLQQQLDWMHAVEQAARRGVPATLRCASVAGRAWDLHVLPFIRLMRAADATDACLLLAVFDSVAMTPAQAVQAFGRHHRLSAAEAGVLAGLCAGADPAAIARASGRARSTVRSQLARIFDKTGVGSQRELLLAVRSMADGDGPAAARPQRRSAISS